MLGLARFAAPRFGGFVCATVIFAGCATEPPAPGTPPAPAPVLEAPDSDRQPSSGRPAPGQAPAATPPASSPLTPPGSSPASPSASSPGAFAGAGGPADPPEFGQTPTAPAGAGSFCDALAVVQSDCQGCHGATPQFGAPMPLVTHADFHKPGISDPSKKMYELVKARIHDSQRPMPPAQSTPLAEAAKSALDTWIAGGAPAGADPTCGGGAQPTAQPTTPTLEEHDWPADCGEKYQLLTSGNGPDGKHVVRANTETHPQFIFDAPWGNEEVQVVASRSITDNARVLHHWIIYSNGGAGGGGGGLFGGIGGGGAGIGKFLIGWAPGKTEAPLPDDVGIFFPSGPNSLRLDMHYYNLGNPQDEPDASGVELCVAREKRQYTATVLGLFGDATARPGRNTTSTSCSATVQGEAYFLTVSPHMHKLGVHGALKLQRGGQTMMLHDRPFDFSDQQVWPLGEPGKGFQIMSGDTLTTECTYENNTGRTVTFGNNSDDEMCFNFVLYYPMGNIQCGLTL